MGKIFTITEGLENMGALRTGGQGSVYKGRRIGEITSAVKLLPTPIHTEDKNDKNYRDYNNEVEKLKKVNEVPNPNVVKILSSGLTESGSFPFIEMEFIEGPDLEELLKAPNDPVFSIPEVIKVAEQLSSALAHCHKVGVKHGDIKSNNVKFNVHTGNYVLLDFGLAIMSDEQRRTSLRHAGAIEFMAPEQNEGEMLFQSDIYSFGVIIYELLSGSVPFPLNDKGETARNKVMLSHMENPVPDVMSVRRQHLPGNWTKERIEREMRVPEWLLGILSKCLEKQASLRFTDGVELHQAIINSHSTDVGTNDTLENRIILLEKENKDLKSQINALKQQEIQNINNSASWVNSSDDNTIKLSKTWFAVMLLLITGLLGFAVYSNLVSEPETSQNLSAQADTSMVDTVETLDSKPAIPAKDNLNDEITSMIDSVIKSDKDTTASATGNEGNQPDQVEGNTDNGSTVEPPDNSNNQSSGKYTLSVDRAYFYYSPEEGSQTKSFLISSNRPELTAIEDKNGYIYVVFFNNLGQVTKGWLRKRDLRRIGS